MDIIGGIAAATEGLKLVNELRKIDKEIDKAELKLRLIDVVDKLMDAKQALVEARAQEQELRQQITHAKGKLSQKVNLRDSNGLLYETDKTGENIGEPYCNLCYVKEDKLFRMRHQQARPGIVPYFLCDNCKTKIVTGPALPRTAPTRLGPFR